MDLAARVLYQGADAENSKYECKSTETLQATVEKLNENMKIQKLFWRNAELNVFLVGWTKFPFYEQEQQERGHGYLRNKIIDISWWDHNQCM